jgi:hypothetical protein
MNQSPVLLASALLLFSTLVAACVEDPIDGEPPTTPAALMHCSTCDDNGLPQESWRIAPTVLSPASLGPAGLRLGTSIVPLCKPGTVTVVGGATHCDLDPAWNTWANLDYRNAALVAYMVHVGGKHGDVVVANPGAGWYVDLAGEFSLAPSALTAPWDIRTQSLITAGMAVAVDMVANGVHICMKTAGTPDCPIAGYPFQEISSVGNVFEGRREVVIGGYDAETPELSKRVCPTGDPAGPLLPCNTYSNVRAYHSGACTYVGLAGQRFPSSCLDPAGGPPFIYAVQVFTEAKPTLVGSPAPISPML